MGREECKSSSHRDVIRFWLIIQGYNQGLCLQMQSLFLNQHQKLRKGQLTGHTEANGSATLLYWMCLYLYKYKCWLIATITQKLFMSFEHKVTFFIYTVHFVSKIPINASDWGATNRLASVRESFGVSKTEDANALIQLGHFHSVRRSQRSIDWEKMKLKSNRH